VSLVLNGNLFQGNNGLIEAGHMVFKLMHISLKPMICGTRISFYRSWSKRVVLVDVGSLDA
jgi:hypothetical protein